MIPSKRGMNDTVVEVIIIFASALVLFMFFGSVLEAKVFGDREREICRQSVSLQGTATRFWASEDKFQLRCNTYNVKFFEDHVEIDGETISVYDKRKDKDVKSFDSLTDDIVNQVVAEELRLCWMQFWEGKKKFGGSMTVFNSQGDNCFVCDEVLFDASVNKQTFRGFFQYLNQTTIPGSDKTYYEYLTASALYDSSLYGDSSRNVWEQFADGVGVWKGIKSGKLGSRAPIVRDIIFETQKTYLVYFDREGQQVAAESPSEKVRSDDKKTSQGTDTTMTFFSYVINADPSVVKGYCDYLNRGTVS